MQLTRYERPVEFSAHAGAFLEEHEAENNLILGLITELIQAPNAYPLPPYLAVIHEGEQVIGASIRTPPHNLLLSLMPDAALEPLMSDLMQSGIYIPGVIAPAALAARFAGRWEKVAGLRAKLEVALRIYALTEVVPAERTSGTLRQANAADQELLVEWLCGFQQDAFGSFDRMKVEFAAQRWVSSPVRRIFFWCAPEPVAMLGVTGLTPNGLRISSVYTPPEQRRRGYASALVAAVSRLLLDEGRKFCFLFTDLANPTSNHIYQEIGYRPVCDVDEYRFVEAMP